jgi:hypothetical protein
MCNPEILLYCKEHQIYCCPLANSGPFVLIFAALDSPHQKKDRINVFVLVWASVTKSGLNICYLKNVQPWNSA